MHCKIARNVVSKSEIVSLINIFKIVVGPFKSNVKIATSYISVATRKSTCKAVPKSKLNVRNALQSSRGSLRTFINAPMSWQIYIIQLIPRALKKNKNKL
jgi:hypothetical protein